MMDRPTKRAIQRMGASAEHAFDNVMDDPSEHDVRAARTATVHIRQDLAGSLAMQAAIHSQLVTISRGVWALVLLAVIAGVAKVLS